jgi:hypothetical protein
MQNQTNPFNTLNYDQLRATDCGKSLVAKSQENAAIVLFNLGAGEVNSHVTKTLSANDIYSAVTLASSLTFDADGNTFSIEPCYKVDEETALTILQDIQSTIENSLLLSHMNQCVDSYEYLPGSAKQIILDICMLDVVDEYDTPDDIPEWKWIEENACYHHRQNSEHGIWEYILNLSCFEKSRIPEKLQPVIESAQVQECSYILFHSGT